MSKIGEVFSFCKLELAELKGVELISFCACVLKSTRVQLICCHFLGALGCVEGVPGK